jgi:hypothetical protein
MKPTLIFTRGHYVGGSLKFWPGQEVPPDTFTAEEANRMLDLGALAECTERPSLFRVFHRFHRAATPEKPIE